MCRWAPGQAAQGPPDAGRGPPAGGAAGWGGVPSGYRGSRGGREGRGGKGQVPGWWRGARGRKGAGQGGRGQAWRRGRRSPARGQAGEADALSQNVGLSLESQVLVGVVDKVASRAVGTAALEVELVAEFGLVLGVAVGLAQLPQAVRELALGPVATAAALGEGPAELGLVARGGGSRGRRGGRGRQLGARAGSQGREAGGRGHPAAASALHQAGGAAGQAGELRHRGRVDAPESRRLGSSQVG